MSSALAPRPASSHARGHFLDGAGHDLMRYRPDDVAAAIALLADALPADGLPAERRRPAEVRHARVGVLSALAYHGAIVGPQLLLLILAPICRAGLALGRRRCPARRGPRREAGRPAFVTACDPRVTMPSQAAPSPARGPTPDVARATTAGRAAEGDDAVEAAVRAILEAIGEDPDRSGLAGTPAACSACTGAHGWLRHGPRHPVG